MTARRFELHRDIDESGISGTGLVAEGVVCTDGIAMMRWLTEWPSSVCFYERGIESVEALHGHGGKTRIVMLDENDLGTGRDALGRRVREVWIAWAKRQPNPKPSWLTPYDDLAEADKEANRCIGSALWGDGFAIGLDVGTRAVTLPPIDGSRA